jgi:hypothetical protein
MIIRSLQVVVQRAGVAVVHGVAAQVAPFESKRRNRFLHLIGARVETRRLSSYGLAGGFKYLYSPRPWWVAAPDRSRPAA